MRKRSLVVALAALAALPAPAGANVTPPHVMAVLRPCAAAQLRANKSSEDAGMLHRELRIRLTNVSSRACAIDGFPAVRLLDAAHNPQIVAESFSREPQLLILAPQQSAMFALRIATGDGTTTYRSVPLLAVIPPGDVTPLYLRIDLPAAPRIDVTAVLAPAAFR
jgi:hypothetical protein